MNSKASFVTKTVYIVLGVAILMQAYYRLDPNSDLGDIVWMETTALMVLLSFPSGIIALLCALAVTFLVIAILGWGIIYFAEMSSIPNLAMWLAISLQWLAILAAGYFQWFWLVPRLYRKIRIQFN